MSSFDIPVEFRRIYKGPLDPTTVFHSLTELNNYLIDPVRYAGQIATLIGTGTVQIYQLNSTEDAWIPVITGDSAVITVNGETGNILITPDSLDDSLTINKFLTAEQKLALHSHTNKNILDGTEEMFTTVLKNKIINIDGGTF